MGEGVRIGLGFWGPAKLRCLADHHHLNASSTSISFCTAAARPRAQTIGSEVKNSIRGTRRPDGCVTCEELERSFLWRRPTEHHTSPICYKPDALITQTCKHSSGSLASEPTRQGNLLFVQGRIQLMSSTVLTFSTSSPIEYGRMALHPFTT